MFIYKKTCIKRNVALLLIFIARYTYSFRGESTSVTRWNIKIKYYQFWILIDFKYFLHPFAHFAIINSLKLNLNLRQTSSLICNPLFIIFSTQSGLTVSVFYVTYCTTYSLFFRISIIDQFASLIRNLSYRSFLKTDLISKTKAIKRTKAIYQKHRSTFDVMYFHRFLKSFTPWSWSMKWRNSWLKLVQRFLNRSSIDPRANLIANRTFTFILPRALNFLSSRACQFHSTRVWKKSAYLFHTGRFIRFVFK